MNKIKALILCNWGNSSGKLARALNANEKEIYSEERGVQSSDLPNKEDWDIVIIAPHIRYELNQLQKHFYPKPVIVGDVVGYYSCDTKLIKSQIKKALKD